MTNHDNGPALSYVSTTFDEDGGRRRTSFKTEANADAHQCLFRENAKGGVKPSTVIGPDIQLA